MEEMGKIAAFGVAAALCAVMIRRQSPELAMVLALIGGAMILGRALYSMTGVRDMLDTLQEAAGLSPAVVAPVIKTVGVGLLTRFSAELCKDAGEGGLAAFIETAGAAAALFLALPLMGTVLTMITGLL